MTPDQVGPEALSPADLYEEPRAPGSRWTRVNIGEAIPGVPTPLSWSLWRPAMEHGFWWSQEQLGVAPRRGTARPRVTGIALGHPAISVDVTVGQIAQLPGYDADAFAEQYFGLPRPSDDGATARRRDPLAEARVAVRVAARAPLAMRGLRRRVHANAAASQAAWSASVHGPVPAADEARALLAVARTRFIDAMAVHTLAGVVCQGVYERVGRLAGEATQQLVSADGDLAEAHVAGDLWAMARGALDQAEVLRRHGFHGPDEGELSARSWREDPAPVAAAGAAWRDAPPDRSPQAATARRAAERAAAEANLLASLPGARRPAARLLLRTARRMIAEREVGKAAFLRHLDVARFAARALGDDAMFCTFEELQADARPSTLVLDGRRRRRADLAQLELPLSWIGDPTPVSRAASPAGTVGHAAGVRGTGASPGQAQGRARVVVDPTRLGDPIGPDEVLVAHTTDPSWVTLFLTAGALVIDVGGALSHGAIIARELGIPCVIGTGDGTTRIPDGALVTVDGTTGTVDLC